MSNTEEIIVIKDDGEREPFSSEKLRASILRSGASNEVTEKVVSHILPELHTDMKSSEIYSHAFSILKNINRPAARNYSLRRAVMDLGPTGFPFEDFIARILEAKGFKCLTRQILLGGCVPHEVDIVAYNKNKLIVIEAKFHNEIGNKSDLKVALYIKARFDDLKENVFNYDGKDRKITDSWLITNTKFSTTAIHYGVCTNLTLIGWNYPETGNLQDMIEEEALHPITCLTTLSMNEKRALLKEGIVLCSDLKGDAGAISRILGNSFEKEKVMSEINEL